MSWVLQSGQKSFWNVSIWNLLTHWSLFRPAVAPDMAWPRGISRWSGVFSTWQNRIHRSVGIPRKSTAGEPVRWELCHPQRPKNFTRDALATISGFEKARQAGSYWRPFPELELHKSSETPFDLIKEIIYAKANSLFVLASIKLRFWGSSSWK